MKKKISQACYSGGIQTRDPCNSRAPKLPSWFLLLHFLLLNLSKTSCTQLYGFCLCSYGTTYIWIAPSLNNSKTCSNPTCLISTITFCKEQMTCMLFYQAWYFTEATKAIASVPLGHCLVGHGPDQILVPPEVATHKWCQMLYRITLSTKTCDSNSKWVA